MYSAFGNTLVCVSGSVFSLLSAEDREKLKRVSASAKQVTSGQSAAHMPEVDKLSLPETASTIKDSGTSSDIKDFSFDGNGKLTNAVICAYYTE